MPLSPPDIFGATRSVGRTEALSALAAPLHAEAARVVGLYYDTIGRVEVDREAATEWYDKAGRLFLKGT